MSRWTITEDTYLATHFASATMADMMQATGRSMHGIYCRAKILGLRRENRGRIGHGRFLKGTPFRPGTTPHKTNVRDAIIKALVEHTERTTRQLATAANASPSSIWKACDALKNQGNLHVTRFQPVVRSPGNYEAVYRIGAGIDAIRPDNRKQEPQDDPYEIQPIPRPTLGLWGLVWNTTNAGQAPAERI